MNFENRPTHSLRPYPGNARTHSPKQIKQIARSIEQPASALTIPPHGR